MLKQAVFLVGGRGTRLGALTDTTPKPFISVGGRPFLSYLIDNAVRHGFKDIILLAGYRAEVLRDAWGEGSAGAAALKRQGVNITVIEEPSAAGTAGALLHVRDKLDEQFLLANGDSFFDFNWLDLRTLDTANDWLARMALRQIPDGSRYGQVEFNSDRITAFKAQGKSGPALVNGGVYVLRRAVLDHVNRTPMSIEQDVFPNLAASGQLYGRAYDGFFIDIGIPTDLARADATMLDAFRRPAAFLDRDGVLNVDHGYVCRPENFDWIPGAKEAIKLLNDKGYFVFVITNQAGIARGYYSEEDMHALHGWVAEQLQEVGAHIDQIEYCPDHPDGVVDRYRQVSNRRKPGPGMILACIDRWPVDCEKSFVIGDKQIDLDAARSANITGHLFKAGNLFSYVQQIVGDKKRGNDVAKPMQPKI